MAKKTVIPAALVIFVLLTATLTGLVGGAAVPAQAASPGAWTVTGTLNTARASHSATRLPDGKVLVTGGMDSTGNPLAGCEIYDPAAGTWTATAGPLNHARLLHSATLLADGRVLVAGGVPNKCELYRPPSAIFKSGVFRLKRKPLTSD